MQNFEENPFEVIIRVRPLIQRELIQYNQKKRQNIIKNDNNSVKNNK